MNPLFSLSQITLVDRKKYWFQNEFVYAIVSVNLVDERPPNRLQLILIVHKEYIES